MNHEDRIASFIKYNNAVPIILGLLFLGGGGAFAATNPDAIYSVEAETRTVDNSYLLSADLESYPFSMRITGLTEDQDYFYVAYEFDTIDIVDGVWRDVAKQNELRISKALLGDGDLEEYAKSELAQVRDFEKGQLAQTQETEKRLGLSAKTVAITHTGLIGKMIRPGERVEPFYQSPEAQSKNDPLALRNPKPLETWDENAVQPAATSSSASSSGPPPAFNPFFPYQDACPNIPGFQLYQETCAGTPPEEEDPTPTEPVGTTTPPIPDPEPVGTSTPPVPEPEPEPVGTTTPPVPEPAPEPEPVPEPEPEPAPEPPPEPEPAPEQQPAP